MKYERKKVPPEDSVKNYPTLEGFFIPEALCPLAIDPFIVALAASYIAPRNVGCAKQTWEDTALRMYGIDPTEFADYMWAALRTNACWKRHRKAQKQGD